MFCKNCGSQMSDNAKFCGKCGTLATGGQTSTQISPPAYGGGFSAPEKPGGKQRGDAFSFSPRVWAAAGGLAAVLILAVIIGIGIGKGGKAPRVPRGSGETSGAAVMDENGEGNSGVFNLNLNSAVVLEGNYANLQSLTMSANADGAVKSITYKENASFPKLENLECGALYKVSDSGEKGYFDERDFPQLKNVTMKLANKYIDEDVMMTYRLFSDMYEQGRLQSFQVEISHTIEDLYGTWTDEKQTLSLTFEKSGILRIADAGNLIGVDAFQYREADDDTLSLSADQSGLLGKISINMEYELFGDFLQVRFSGQEFALTRK